MVWRKLLGAVWSGWGMPTFKMSLNVYLSPLVNNRLVNAEQNFLNVLRFMQNLHMMGEADAQKLIAIDFARHWRPFCQRVI